MHGPKLPGDDELFYEPGLKVPVVTAQQRDHNQDEKVVDRTFVAPQHHRSEMSNNEEQRPAKRLNKSLGPLDLRRVLP